MCARAINNKFHFASAGISLTCDFKLNSDMKLCHVSEGNYYLLLNHITIQVVTVRCSVSITTTKFCTTTELSCSTQVGFLSRNFSNSFSDQSETFILSCSTGCRQGFSYCSHWSNMLICYLVWMKAGKRINVCLIKHYLTMTIFDFII